MEHKITNKFNLPEEVYNALCKNRYSADDGGDRVTDFSVSTLTAPVQQTILRRRYPDTNSEDCIDRCWTLFGHIAHQLLEEHGSDDSLTEKRFYMTIQGRTISGQIDHYKNRKITDYKTTSAYKIQSKSYEDWSKQQNCYATLCEENGLEVDGLRIIAIIRDWSERDAGQPGYPEAPIEVIPLVKWAREVRKNYMEGRVQLLIDNEALPDDKLLPCTDEERWRRIRDYAVYKVDENGVPTSARATKVFQSEDDAVDYRREKGSGYASFKRMTDPRRCLKYCNVSEKCCQHAAYLKEQGEKDGQVEG